MLLRVQMSPRALSTTLQLGPRCSLNQDYSLPPVALQGLDTVHNVMLTIVVMFFIR